MAALTREERDRVTALLMKAWSNELEDRPSIELLKAETRDFVDRTDQWITDNQASFNAALSDKQRTTLSAKEKARGFFFVAGKKFDVEV